MAGLKQVTVPDIGDFADVAVVEVHVAPGDAVAENDPLITLETDKATIDVPAPFAGVAGEVLVKVGDAVSQGTPVVLLSVAAGAHGAAASDAPVELPPTNVAAVPTVSRPDAPAYASPSVRRLARELVVDLAGVEGSGRKGRIVPADVRASASGSASAGPRSGGASLDLLPWPQVDFEKFGEVERVPLTRVRRISAANLARNWVMIPHVTHSDEADITDLEAFRKRLNAEQSDVKVTMVALLLKAAAATLKVFPDVNASLDGEELVRKKYYHLGFAAETPQGLMVPVVRDVDQKGLLELAAELAVLSRKARIGKIGPAEMSGGTFTISSLGGIGGTSFTPIVNAPEVAVLGVVRSVTKPIWDGQAFVPRLMLPLSLSYDHRVVDGAAAARFVAYLSGVLSDLSRALL